MGSSFAGVRFAPSPTGTFHLGNLRTAWVSHELARRLGLAWVLRFEDIDTPRVLPGAMERQLEHMKLLGLVADDVRIQSEHRERHWALFLRARAEGMIYPCTCSRKEISQDLARELEQVASAPHREVPLYSGRCRTKSTAAPGEVRHETLAWRFKSEDPSGTMDFVIARTGALLPDGQIDPKTFVPGYNWACAIDDLDGGYSLLVRCVDLKAVASQQWAIQKWVAPGAPLPSVFHTAMVVASDGSRLEKRTRGVTLPELMESGITPAALVSAFAASFTSDLAHISPGELYGEAVERITQRELLGTYSVGRLPDTR